MALIVPVVVGVLALIWLMATAPMMRQIAQALAGAPFGLGPWLVSQVGSMVPAALNFARSWGEAALAPLLELFNTVHDNFAGHSQAVSAAVSAAADATWFMRYAALPASQAIVEEYSRQLAQQSIQYAADLSAADRGYTLRSFQAATARADQETQGAEQYAQALAASAEHFAQDLYQQAVRYTFDTSAQGRAFTAQAVTGAETYAEDLAAQAERYAAMLAQQAISYAQALSLDDRRVIQGVAATDQAYARSLAGSVAQYAQSLAVPIAAAVTAIEQSPCMQRCSVLGNLGGELEALEFGLILAAMTFMVSDPGGAAGALAGEVTKDMREAGQAIAGLLGIEI